MLQEAGEIGVVGNILVVSSSKAGKVVNVGSIRRLT